ncbi:polysaccharide biosynthesis protein [Clostridium sp.]|uniref:polysaccharide biosynthesis protein n=1 Tax=Clostridium sp. TaxID=1506 RepID=UPI003463D1B6
MPNVKKKLKIYCLLLLDIVAIWLCYFLSYNFRFYSNLGNQMLTSKFLEYSPYMVLAIIIYIISFKVFKLYESLWTIAGLDEFLLGVTGCVVGGIINIFISLGFERRIPLLVTGVSVVFITMAINGMRICLRVYRRAMIYAKNKESKNFKRVMIVGAGSAAYMVIRDIRRHPEMKYKVVTLIDDSPYKKNTQLAGVKVVGNRNDIEDVVKKENIDLIIIAIPRLSEEERSRIVKICNRTKIRTKIVPGMYELIGGKVSLKGIRNVDVKDLLGREPVKLDTNEINNYISNKVVMVTGGGGSIGSELCRQIASFRPKTLIILDIYENNAYEIQQELRRKYEYLDMHVLIASVRDKNRLDDIYEEYKPQVVFHAAAHKHVPLMEDSPMEAIKNNVLGTLNVAELAKEYQVERFVLISTDKAVNPTNIMGATKRICEMIVQALDRESYTEFVAVRFGNVLGSNGSVIPLFKKQIAEGGPITLTHKEITRYFMLIPEAAQLVLQAGAYAKGGEIFVLDMGKPVKIYDLACELIRLSGLEPYNDIDIKITGLRPGEKLYEELLMSEEGLKETSHKKIFIGKPGEFNIENIKGDIEELLYIAINGSNDEIKDKLTIIVPTYIKEQKEGINLEKNIKVKDMIAATI